jgi:chemotaxis protein MotB
MASNVQQMTPPRNVKNQPRRGPKISQGEGQKQDSATSAQIAELREAEDQRFKAASQQLKAAMQKEKELAGLSENLRVDITPEGMRIQIVDREGESMFPSGSARMYDKTRNLLGKVAEVIKDMPNDISVRGHTDAVPYNPGSDYTNWELSSDRANSTRRALLEDGINETRIANVVGKADTDLLLPDKPKSPKNRRISVVLLREKLKTKKGTTGQDGARTGTPSGRTPVERDPDYERTKGKVQFP